MDVKMSEDGSPMHQGGEEPSALAREASPPPLDRAVPPPALARPVAYPTHGLGVVTLSVLIFYAVLLLFDARGIHSWAQKLPVNNGTRLLRATTEKHWQKMAALGLEEPKHTIETQWLDWQEAHPLVYPRKYAVMVQKKKDAALRKEREKHELAADPTLATRRRNEKEVLDSVDSLPQSEGPSVLILGDSLMMTVGPIIKKDVVDRLSGAALVKAKLATGLARPDVFDWTREVKRLTSNRRFDFVVVMLGTNDSQDFADHNTIHTYGTKEWVKAYSQRLGSLMSAACQGGRQVIWLGLPPMQGSSFHRKALRLNAWIQREARNHSCLRYVPTDHILGDAQGGYAGYLEVDERLEKVRTVDGIHVTKKGAALLSRALLPYLGGGAVASH